MGRRASPEEHFTEDLGMFEPPHNGTATSKDAAKRIESSADRLRQKVLEYIQICDDMGATREEIEIGLEMPGNTVRPRVLELIRAGKVYEMENVTRETQSGRHATILRAAATH